MALPAVGLVLMPRWSYTLLLRLLLPAVLLWQLWRGWRHPAQKIDLWQRLGCRLPRLAGRPVWIHAASVGEVQAAAALIRRLHSQDNTRALLLTTGTATGLQRARLLFGELLTAPAGGVAPLSLLPAPYDLPGAVRRFLRATRPLAGILVETELWPNLIAVSAALPLPLALVSARVSERSTARYLRYAPRLLQRMLRSFHCIAAQSPADAARFLRLGADAQCLQVAGDLKFDFALPESLAAQASQLRARVAPARGLWVAGSTHPGEEGACLAAQRELRQLAAGAAVAPPLCVLAPRHPDRFEAVAGWLQEQGVAFVRQSSAQATRVDTDVLLLDSLGELLGFYAAADAAFVGGSLVPVGGHNLLEPAALGIPVLTGPHSFNSPQAAQLLEASDALRRVRDAHSLAQALWEIFADTDGAARARGARAAAAVAANRGATDRALALLAPMLVEATAREPVPGRQPSATG